MINMRKKSKEKSTPAGMGYGRPEIDNGVIVEGGGGGAHFTRAIPVGPNPPVRNAALGKQETTHKQKGEEEEAASCAGNHLVSGKGAQSSKHSNAHAVHQKQQQDVGEEPAMNITTQSDSVPGTTQA